MISKGVERAQGVLGCSDSTLAQLRYGGSVRRHVLERLLARLDAFEGTVSTLAQMPESYTPPPSSDATYLAAMLHATGAMERALAIHDFPKAHVVAGLGIAPSEIVLQLLRPRVPAFFLDVIRSHLREVLPYERIFVIPAPLIVTG